MAKIIKQHGHVLSIFGGKTFRFPVEMQMLKLPFGVAGLWDVCFRAGCS